MYTILVVSIIIVIVVLLLAVITTSKAYSFKHTVDSVDENHDYDPENNHQEPDQGKKEA